MCIQVAGFLLETAHFLARSTNFLFCSTVLPTHNFVVRILHICSLYNISHSSILRVFLQQSFHRFLVLLLACIDTHCATRISCYTVSLEDTR